MQLELNGHGVYAEIEGQPSVPGRPCLILIHGAQNDHAVWTHIGGELSQQGYLVVMPDLPGHGKSAGAPLPTIEKMADWLGALMDALSKPSAGDSNAAEQAPAGAVASPQNRIRFALIGHSMGSLVALECAARFPTLIASVILVCTAIPMKVSPALLALAKSDEAAAITQINLWSHAPPPATAEAQQVRDELMTRSRQIMAQQEPGVLHTDLSACSGYQTGLATAAAIHCPALIIAGSRDQMTPPKFTGNLLAALAKGRQQTIEDAGHAMMTENTDALISSLTGFLAQ